MAQAGAQNQFLIIVVILILFVVLRIRRVIKGTRVSLARTIGFSAYYIAFASLFVLSSFFEGISPEYFILDALVFAASAILSFMTVNRLLHFWRGSDGSVFSKGGIVIYLIYIAGLIARLSIGYIFIGPSAFNFATTPVNLTSAGIIATIVTDLLLVFGAGLLFGRNMRILKRFSAIKRGEEQISPAKNESKI